MKEFNGAPPTIGFKATTGRGNAADHPIQAIRAAFQAPWPRLKREAVEILRSALTTSTTPTEAARKLFTNLETLKRLQRDFPIEYLEACAKRGRKIPLRSL